MAHRELLHRIRRPLSRTRHVAVASMKGGVGKTTVATLLGLVLAESRGDRVVALDANPDAGTLADRLTGESTVTVRELVRDLERIDSWAAVSYYTSLVGRLQVLASEQDAAAGDGLSRDEYDSVSALLERYFNIIITDSGTGFLHPAMAGILARAQSLVIVGAPTVDGAGRASKTLDWLWSNGFALLARDAVAVLSSARSSPDVDSDPDPRALRRALPGRRGDPARPAAGRRRAGGAGAPGPGHPRRRVRAGRAGRRRLRVLIPPRPLPDRAPAGVLPCALVLLRAPACADSSIRLLLDCSTIVTVRPPARVPTAEEIP